MYHKITNPLTNRKVSINSKIGRNIIMNYVTLINRTGGGVGLKVGQKSKLVNVMTTEPTLFPAPQYNVAFSPNGKFLATASKDGTVRLFEVPGGNLITTIGRYDGHSKPLNGVAFSPNGKLMATGSNDHTARVWNGRGKCVALLKEHSNQITAVAFSPVSGGAPWNQIFFLATASKDGTVRVWKVPAQLENREEKTPASCECTATLKHRFRNVLSVAFSPNGKFLATGSMDKKVRVWEVASGACVATLEGHSDSVKGVAFSNGWGKFLASASSDNTARVSKIVSA